MSDLVSPSYVVELFALTDGFCNLLQTFALSHENSLFYLPPSPCYRTDSQCVWRVIREKTR